MKVSKSFLNDYIDIKDKDFSEVASKMVFLGNEFDSLSKISTATDLVIGYVLERKDHPDSNKLNVCKVDIGDGNTYQIVCGAPNVDSGQKVIVAKVGATLPGNIVIKKSEIRGVESNGMICSLAELGLENKYLTKADVDGIHELPADAPLGVDAIAYLGYDDEVIDFDLTSNRGDLLSMIGMAYEIGALYDLEVKYPETEVEVVGEDINNNYKLDVETENCLVYLASLVKNVKIGESPKFIKNRLMASGIRPINNVVDISNYIMLETGQPLHFFDADKLRNHILVRMAKDGEEIVTIDKKNRTLTNTDIVITDTKNPVALAGVMGGYDSEVTVNTTNIMIEAAIFNPTNIRNTAKKTLRSEASSRYEKGINSDITLVALKRAGYLLNKYANGSVVKGILKHDSLKVEPKKIEITLDRINTILGMNLNINDVELSFRKLKLDHIVEGNKFIVSIPNRRLDLTIPEDLIEEVGRIVGYDKVVGILPTSTVKKGSISPKMQLVKGVRKRLEALGLKQVITYSLISNEESTLFVNEEKELVKLLDPNSEDKSIMRNSLIPSLLNVYNYNNARSIKDINIFEIGSRYYKENDNYVEVNTLSVLMSGTYMENIWQNKKIEVDFYLVKGIVENLLNFLGLNNRYSFEVAPLKDMHPSRSAIIKIGLEEVGFIGEVHPNLSKKPVYVFELNLDKIMDIKIRNIKFKELTKYPSIHKDVAFVVDKQLNSADIINVIKRSGGRLLTEIDVFDVYAGSNLNPNKKSIAYSLVFSDPNKTLTDEEVNVVINKIITDVETKLGAKLRDN
ncbi:MAG: phenylalanine--tRNA ligase subunit beta [Bacilli bacterium]|nr:phenylalanine--tRNA ligase subunit beta [Bacilli bacterium]MDD4547750.1 phenylalanine--tRNA ligase subunit beta [Bacilli bacterium]